MPSDLLEPGKGDWISLDLTVRTWLRDTMDIGPLCKSARLCGSLGSAVIEADQSRRVIDRLIRTPWGTLLVRNLTLRFLEVRLISLLRAVQCTGFKLMFLLSAKNVAKPSLGF